MDKQRMKIPEPAGAQTGTRGVRWLATFYRTLNDGLYRTTIEFRGSREYSVENNTGLIVILCFPGKLGQLKAGK